MYSLEVGFYVGFYPFLKLLKKFQSAHGPRTLTIDVST